MVFMKKKKKEPKKPKQSSFLVNPYKESEEEVLDYSVDLNEDKMVVLRKQLDSLAKEKKKFLASKKIEEETEEEIVEEDEDEEEDLEDIEEPHVMSKEELVTAKAIEKKSFITEAVFAGNGVYKYVVESNVSYKPGNCKIEQE